jgi:cellulose synthase/poly-beta-1,6-N-acetylglucosamine synthase-like glycosyltransferase
MIKGSISVIIACRNEEANIAHAIMSILKSDYPLHLIEIIVVDGKSDDNSTAVVKSLSDEFPNIKLVHNIKQITPIAFNLGIKNSVSEYIQIISARHTISANYISTCINLLTKNNKIACVGGGAKLNYDNLTGEIIASAYKPQFGVGPGNVYTLKRSAYTDTAIAPVFRKTVFDEVGAFDESLVRNQDDELSYRIKKAGYEIYTCMDIWSQYYVRNKFVNLFKQYYQYGYWKVFVNKKHRAVTTTRQIFPAIFVLFLFLGLPLLLLLHLWFLYIAILLVYFFFVFSLNNGKTVKKKILISYAIFLMHFGYGLAYLNGLLDFFILNADPSDKHKKLTR